MAFLPSTGPFLLQYRHTRKDVPTGTVVTTLLMGGATAPLIRTESCSTGGKLCLVLEAWLEPLVMEMTVPRHEPIGVVFLNVADAVSCLLSIYI